MPTEGLRCSGFHGQLRNRKGFVFQVLLHASEAKAVEAATQRTSAVRASLEPETKAHSTDLSVA